MMRVLSIRILVLTLLGSVAFCLPAMAQTVPQGSYLKTCRDASVGDNDLLLANCQMADGQWRMTNLPNASSCRGDISNVDGRLRCVAASMSGNQPGNTTGDTTEFREGYATFGGACDGQAGAQYLELRLAGRPDSLVKLVWRRKGKIDVFLPRGSTYAITCGAFQDNPTFSYANLN
jgi:hypothetical protein